MLPYTAEVYFSLMGRYLDALGPLFIVALALALAALALTLRPVPHSDRAIGLLLVAGWLNVGAVFHLQYFANLNFIAPLYGIAFVLEGVWLAWQGPIRNRLAFRFRGGVTGWTGLTIAALALAGYPLLDGLTRGEWLGVRFVGLAPSPTALFTLGMLLVAERVPLGLFLIPVAWSLAAGFAGWRLGIPMDMALPVMALATIASVARKTHGARQRASSG